MFVYSASLCAGHFPYPKIYLSFPSPVPTTVFYGETLRIPLQMHYLNLRGSDVWHLPPGSGLEIVGGYCPILTGSKDVYWVGVCYRNIVIPGDRLGKVIAGRTEYIVKGSDGYPPHRHTWGDDADYSPAFYVTVIPHPLSMSPIPIQKATANTDFVYNLQSVVRYYNENVMAGTPAQGLVNPVTQDGLRFDQASFSIVGKPQRTGTYVFQVGAINGYGAAAPTELKIEVGVNLKDKPRVKNNAQMISAIADKKYSMNLMALIEEPTRFMLNNQIAFHMVANKDNPTWLKIADDDATRIEGLVPAELAGQEMLVSFIASSNTGGDSDEFSVRLPIATDPTKKPLIESFQLERSAGMPMNADLSLHIKDPAQHSSLRVLLDKVEPAAPWLEVSSSNQTALEGNVPREMAGQTYQLTLRANTLIGGSSKPVTIPLHISEDKQLTPRFKAANPILPMLYVMQPFVYDFVENKDIYPEFKDIPYEISFAKEYEHPSWLKIENNKLVSESVPEDIDSDIAIHLVIKNIPGGSSEVILLSLTAMN